MSNNLRSLIPSIKNKIYFNYGGQGPLPNPSLNKIIKSWEKLQEIGPFTNNVWPYINNEVVLTKKLLAKSMGVNIRNIALSENISTGMILPLWGIDFSEGDELLISDCEHPGIVAACREICKRLKLKLNIFPIQKIRYLSDEIIIDETKKYLKKNTKALIISHILWNFGYEVPLKELKDELQKANNNSYLIVDGAQSFGHIEISEKVKYSDLYAITSHKWACGPEGLGAFYVSDRFMDNTRPTIIGWKSLKKEQGIYEPSENLLQEDARKFEIATSCIPLLAGLRESLYLFEEDICSNEKIKIISTMSNKLWFELSEFKNIELALQYPLKNGIVSFNINKVIDKNEFVRKLGLKNIWIRVIEDPKWFRVCIHQITNEKEIDLLINEMKLLI
tara:strand:+ start:1674 stop:2846 length:1173 start_codon:yes stop_codon:yes gene_type:complete